MTDEGKGQCKGGQDGPFESEAVGKGSDCEVEHNIHSPGVEGVDELLPVGNGTPVGVSYAEVEWGVA